MQDVLILKNAVIFDGVNEEPLCGKSLVIADGKIDAICDGEAVCTGDVRIIDLDGAFVSPGFIDCHMHMLLDEIPADKNRTLSTMSAGGELYPNADSAAAFFSGSLSSPVCGYGGTAKPACSPFMCVNMGASGR